MPILQAVKDELLRSLTADWRAGVKTPSSYRHFSIRYDVHRICIINPRNIWRR
jgi:hypothetical protein